MSAAWVVYLLVAGTLLALGAHAAASALGVARRATRWAWAAALAGLLALGGVAPRAHSLALVATASASDANVAMIRQTSNARSIGALVDAVGAAMQASLGRTIEAISMRVPAGAARALTIGWALASVVLLVLYLAVNARMSRARRHWPRERLHGMDVRVARAVGPAVIGVVRAEIVVPRALLDRTAEEQRLILAHEHEHLRARDNVLLGLACVAVIALPWHPAVWYLLARLRLALELDCDARVLRRGAAPRSYGALLIDMAAHGAGMRLGTLALADRPSHLERRLMAMRSSRSRFAMVRGGVACAVAGLLVLAACEAKVPTSAELSSMGMAEMQRSAAQTGAFSGARFATADFFLDGAKITREELLKYDAARIGSMEIVKGARDTVLVTSTERMAQRSVSGDPNAHPVIMIDGIVSTESALSRLNQDDIVTVNVMKPKKDAAVDRYPNGLIVIETKAHQRRAATPAATSSRSNALPAYTIDGARATHDQVEALSREQITSVDVLKGASATLLSSDPAAVNGLVRVTTRAGAKQ